MTSLLEFRAYVERGGQVGYPRIIFNSQGASSTASLALVYGSWRDSPSINGNMQSTFRVFSDGSDGALQNLNSVAAFLKRARTYRNDVPTAHEKLVVVQRLDGQSYTREARVLGGSMAPVDGRVIDRFQATGKGEWIITFERLPNWEYQDSTKAIEWPNERQLSIFGGASGGDETLHYLTGLEMPIDGRITKTVLSPVALSNQEYSIAKFWLGIWENHYITGGWTTAFDPTIQMDMDAVERTAVGTTTDGSGTGFTADWAVSISYYPGEGDYRDWYQRFFMPLKKWNSCTRTAGNAGVESRRQYMGRYRLLMRYKTNQPAADIDEPVVQSLIKYTTYWFNAGRNESGDEQVSEGPMKSIWHEDEDFHWIDLGELVVGSNELDYEVNYQIDPGNFAIGIYAKGANVPDDSATRGQYKLLVDKFVLMPADKMVYAEIPGTGVGIGREIQILTDDQDRISVYAVKSFPRTFETQTSWANQAQKVLEVQGKNWTTPQNVRAVVVGVADVVEGTPDTDFTMNVEMWATQRSPYDTMDIQVTT